MYLIPSSLYFCSWSSLERVSSPPPDAQHSVVGKSPHNSYRDLQVGAIVGVIERLAKLLVSHSQRLIAVVVIFEGQEPHIQNENPEGRGLW